MAGRQLAQSRVDHVVFGLQLFRGLGPECERQGETIDPISSAYGSLLTVTEQPDISPVELICGSA